MHIYINKYIYININIYIYIYIYIYIKYVGAKAGGTLWRSEIF